MEPKTLSDLTAQMLNRSAIVAGVQHAWLHLKYGGNLDQMRQEAQKQRFSSVPLSKVLMAAVPAADSTTTGWALELLPDAALNVEWCLSITALTLLGKMKTLSTPFDTRMAFDLSPGSAAWVAQGMPAPMTRMSLSRTDRLGLKKVVTILPIDGELLEIWNPAVSRQIEDLASRVIRFAVDRSILDPDLVANDARPRSLTNGIPASQSTGSSAAQIIADLAAAIGPVLASSADPTCIVIALAPATALFYSKLENAAGLRVFPNLGVNGGDIWGITVLVTPAAIFSGSPSSNLITIIDASRILVADNHVMTIDSSSVASMQMTDAPASGPTAAVSFFQTNTVAMRLVLYKNFTRVTDAAVRWFPVSY